ncbi:MAG: hemolysin family protein [Thermodesulfobacteriota bacterium]
MGLLAVMGLMAGLLLVKGFFSGSEIALVSADKIQMHHRARMGDKGAKLFLKMFQKPDRLLTTTLVGTNLATVGLATLGALLMIKYFGERGDLIAFLIFTPIFLIFGEIVPKSIYQQKAEMMAPIIVYPLKGASFLFFPVTFFFSQIARAATRLAGAGKAPQSVFLTREQLRAVLEMTERRSEVSAFTQGRIRRAIRFGDTQAAEVMTPVSDMPLLDSESTEDQLLSLVRRIGYRSIAVYTGSTANIIGVISLAPWEVMKENAANTSVSDLIQPPYYAAPQQTLGRLLPVLWERKDQSAIIVDEFGSAIGMVTLEDILRVVVGETKAGFHFEKHPYRHERTLEVLDEGIYLLDARLPISEVNDVIGLNLPTRDYRTIGGMFLSYLSHVPKEGEYIVDSGYRFTVVEATPKAVVRVQAEPEV